jgi:hypothetical protein
MAIDAARNIVIFPRDIKFWSPAGSPRFNPPPPIRGPFEQID